MLLKYKNIQILNYQEKKGQMEEHKETNIINSNIHVVYLIRVEEYNTI